MRRVFTIFLDIDGVLNISADWKKGFNINPVCVKAFISLCEKILKRYDSIDIVFSSTWRQSFTGNKTGTTLDGVLQGFSGKVRYAGITPVSNKTRQEEIEYYIRRHEVGPSLILDDDQNLFPVPSRLNLFLTDSSTGLKMSDIKRIKL